MCTEKLPSQSPLLEKSDKPALYQSKSDEMMSMLMGTESGSTLPAFTSLQSTGKHFNFVVANHL